MYCSDLVATNICLTNRDGRTCSDLVANNYLLKEVLHLETGSLLSIEQINNSEYLSCPNCEQKEVVLGWKD